MKNNTRQTYLKTPVKKLLFSSTALIFSFFSIGENKVFGDSTYFSEDLNLQEAPPPVEFKQMIQDLETKASSSDKKEKPSQPIPLVPSSSEPLKKDLLSQNSTSKENSLQHEKKPTESLMEAPSSIVNEPSLIKDKPLHAAKNPVAAPTKAPMPEAPIMPHPKAQPLHEKNNIPPPFITKTMDSYSSAVKGKLLLGHLDPNKDIQSQKWYIYSSTKRGLKNPSDKIEIVNVEGKKGPSPRGKEVITLLIEMGLNSKQIQLVNVKEAGERADQIYIFKAK